MGAQYLYITGYIETLPEEQKANVKQCRDELKAIIAQYGEQGLLALASVGAELSDD